VSLVVGGIDGMDGVKHELNVWSFIALLGLTRDDIYSLPQDMWRSNIVSVAIYKPDSHLVLQNIEVVTTHQMSYFSVLCPRFWAS
jgi:hypothetical protein